MITFSIYCFIIIVSLCSCQTLNSENTQNNSKQFCECMEYWECIDSLGQPYSYCHYSNQVCCISNDTLIEFKNEKLKTSTCGKKGVDSGREEFAEFGEWTWHIAIMEAFREFYICGGSLIDENWILTSAHCVDDYSNPQLLKVRAGEYDVLSDNEPEKHDEYKVSKIIIHPKFNNKTLNNDIALLKVNKPVKRKSNVNTICLPQDEDFNDEDLLRSKCFITGWGRISENAEHALVLKEVLIPMWTQKRCQDALKVQFGSTYELSSTSICGGDVGHDACEGDGGGGLFCEKNKSWYQVGIISFGVGCGRKNSPGVYTKVSPFIQWIQDIVWHQ